MDLWAVFYSIF